MDLKKKEESRTTQRGNEGNLHCSVCGCEISEEDYETYDGMCWECWDDQLTEESDMMFGDLM